MSERVKARLGRLRARLAGAVRRRVGQPTGPPGRNASAWAIPDTELWVLRELYEGRFEVPAISHGTVRDLADSSDNMPGLARASFDMKGLQRCWAVKAILGAAPPGARILEIGAGQPLAAGVLSRLGYEVTVVDSYRGEGNGPKEYELFVSHYPDLRFVRENFPPAADLGGPFDAIYSISVLEHIPLEDVDELMSSIAAHLAPGGCSIHAVDHVLAGWSSAEHRRRLERMAGAMGIGAEELDTELAAMERDPETYFVSAEAHDGWRGDLAYDDYPMRRIGSVNLFARAATERGS